MQASPSAIEVVAALVFAVAVVHTFTTRYFELLAHAQPEHAGLWHLLGEVDVVFGFWALVLMVLVTAQLGTRDAVAYLETRSFTEPAFVFVIMVIAGSKPILDLSGAILQWIARLLPFPSAAGYYFVILSVGPLLGSFITEPAAMTLTALLLRDRFFGRNAPKDFMYATLGVLFVNISIGGTLTPFAAPPVVMVAEKWGWDIAAMVTLFGWKAALAVIANAAGAAYLFRAHLRELPPLSRSLSKLEVPLWIIATYVGFLILVVIFSHHAAVFVGAFLFFLGFSEAYKRYRGRLMLREGLLVAFFLAGLVTLGGWQKWWLEALLADMSPSLLFAGATGLTAITDNAALTYLGSLVEGVSDQFKYSLVAGAVTGGGLTVIANAPNPAGFAILKGCFEDGAISPLGLLAAAALPTLVAAAAFQLLPG
jgi:hypothetical protein